MRCASQQALGTKPKLGHTPAWRLLAVAFALTLAACGQKGPLYLPDKGGHVVTSPAATPAGASAPTQPPAGTPGQPAQSAPAESTPAPPSPPKKKTDQDSDSQSQQPQTPQTPQ